jgi:uncharacterized protein
MGCSHEVSAGRRSIINLRHIFRVTKGPSGLDFAVLAVGLAAAMVIIATLTDAVPALSRADMTETASAATVAPDAPIVSDAADGDEYASFTPRLLHHSRPPKAHIAPPQPAPPEPLSPQPASPLDMSSPAWLRYAAVMPATMGRPVIAIILDDMGVDRPRSSRAAMLSAPVTLSYLPYARKLAEQTKGARLRGHELMLHLPMEPINRRENPGPHALLKALPGAELVKRLEWALSRFTGYVGVNNHMGSRLTRDPRAMAVVMGRLKAHGLLFVDSRTLIRSVATIAARDAQVPNAERNIFLDHVDSLDAIRGQLETVERVARRQGFAIAIGHPRDATLAALETWMAAARARGFVFVPVSAIVRGIYSLG